jgi:DNA repair protein RecN (Recombination protein N)
MLVRLAIRDIVLIDRLDLDFGSGLTVLTGETGAGKSILIDALSLALGARGDGDLVRSGSAQGSIDAVFELPANHALRPLLVELDLDAADGLFLRRVQMADGRTRAFANERPISLQTLRRLGALLVEIHGQHDDRAFVDPATHRTMLDFHGGHRALAAATSTAADRLSAARRNLGELRRRAEKAAAEADYLDHAHAELTKLAPEPGEEARLAEIRTRMMQGEKAASDLADALDAVAGSGAPGPAFSAVLRRLERRAASAPELVAEPVRALDALMGALDDARSAIESAMAASSFDPRQLEKTEERLFALRAAARKHRVSVDDLPVKAAAIAAARASIEADHAEIRRMETQEAEAEVAYLAAANALSAARAAAASRLEEAVNAELPPLKLERARFSVRLERDEALRGPDGFDRVEFWVQTNPGARPGPLVAVASGGELARFLLALKVSLADRGAAPTLVFDEIDTGVGGAVADAIGVRLARLGRQAQVIAITHAPQVAARAEAHCLIRKAAIEAGARVVTTISALDPEARREEIARMLAGAKITEEARAAARRLLEGAAAKAPRGRRTGSVSA